MFRLSTLSQFVSLIIVCLTFGAFLPMTAEAWIDGQKHYPTSTGDNGVLIPPLDGPYDYNTFMPGTSGFPTVGGTYVDPIFNETIRRLTNEYYNQSESEIYSKNGWFNADGSLMIHKQ